MSGIDDDNLREELNALLDDALPDERAAELRALIESDASIRREYESLRRVVGAVRDLPRESAPPALQERLRGIATARRPAPILRWAAPLAAAAVVVVAVMIAVKEDRGQDLPDEARVSQDESRPAGDGEQPRKKNLEKGFTGADEKLAGKKKEATLRDDEPAPPGAPKNDRVEKKKPAGKEAPPLAEAVKEEAEETKHAEVADKTKDKDDAAGGDTDLEAEADAEGVPDRGEKDAGAVKPEAKRRKRDDGMLGGGRKSASEGTARGGRKHDPVAAVQGGAPIRTSTEFKAYLRALAARSPAEVRAHVRAFGVTPEKREKKAKSGTTAAKAKKAKEGGGEERLRAASLQTLLADKEEARLLGAALQRAFPPAPSGAKKRSAGSGGGGSAGGGAEPTTTATVADAARRIGKRILFVHVTPLQEKFVRSWLARVSTARRTLRGDAFPKARPSGTFANAKASRKRVELHYPLPPPAKRTGR